MDSKGEWLNAVIDIRHRFVVDKLAEEITQVVFGFDGGIATSEDGGAGRPAVTVTPVVRIVDDNTISVEAKLTTTDSFALPLERYAFARLTEHCSDTRTTQSRSRLIRN